MSKFWRRLPAIVRALILGLLATGTGQLPWSLLVGANMSIAPAIPWSAAVMIVYLSFWWLYLQGHGWPASTKDARRRDLRGTIPAGPILRWSLISAAAAGLALRALADLARRFSVRPGQDLVPPEVLAKYPAATVFILLMMTALVSGTVEEAAFRGYMQSPLERRYGAPAAISLVGAVFSLAHFRPEAPDMIPWLIFIPAYFGGAVAFGALASLSGSILPGLLCHILFNAAGFLYYWRAGIPPSVWDGGFDASFWIRCAALPIFTAAAIVCFRRLASVAAEARK
jgi:membrane protease YdiL (CAAX protease family)